MGLLRNGRPVAAPGTASEREHLAARIDHVRGLSRLAGTLERDLLRLLDGYAELLADHHPDSDVSPSFCEEDHFSWPCSAYLTAAKALEGNHGTRS